MPRLINIKNDKKEKKKVNDVFSHASDERIELAKKEGNFSEIFMLPGARQSHK